MNYAPVHPYFKRFDVHIHYIYYGFTGKKENIDSLKHSIHSNKIIERLEQKNFVLHKEDIVYLLKEDGAHFFSESLRIYDPKEDAYFRVTDDWEFSVGNQEIAFSLLFYVKSTQPNLKNRIDDMNEEIKKLKNEMSTRITGLEEKVKHRLGTMAAEIDRLRVSTKVISDQIVVTKDISAPIDAAALEKSQLSNVPCLSPVEIQAKAINNDSIFSYYQQGVEFRQQDLDIALMYSEPLVKREKNSVFPLGDSVDYEEECSKLLDILSKKEKKINLYFEIATIKHLVNVVSLSPRVLHIICHGDFSKAKNQFYLCFEDNGELVELYSEDLKTRLQAVNFSTQLVFVNACHSEEVAKVFMDAGVSCVVAVHSELKIEDSIAQKFSESFYWQLFEGKSIEQAFRYAQVSITGTNVYTCCCAHSHKPDCEWYKIAKSEGYEKAHYLHTPTCGDCSKKFGNSFKHKVSCKWAIDFMVLKCGNLDIPQEDFHVCCCSPHLEHNETMKFKLICREERLGEQVLFRYKDSGEVSITSTHSCVEPKFVISKIAGRNQEMYEIFNFLSQKDKKIVNLFGHGGLGKTTLAKQVANYMVERGYFREKVCHIYIENIPSITYFRSSLCKQLPGSYDAKTLCQSIKNNNILFILEKCDKLVNEYHAQFVQDLSYMMINAPNVKFIITTTKKISLNLGEFCVEMRQLRKLDAAKLLYKHASQYLNMEERNIYTLEQRPVFDLIPLTPQGIWLIAEKLKSFQTLEQIERELTQEKERCEQTSQKSSVIEKTILETVEKLQEESRETYELLTFMYLFPSGLSYQDLEELSLKGKVPAEWKTLLLYFLYTKAFSNLSNKAPEDEEVGNNEEIRGLARLNSNIFRKGRVIERKDFKPDNYLWMNIVKDPTDNEIWFLPAQSMTKCIEKHLGGQGGDQILKKLEYMSALAYTVIERIKLNNDYIEKLLECSAVCNYGFWRNDERELLDQNSITYINQAEYDFNNLKRRFEAHELNFFSCLESETLKIVYKKDNENVNHILNIIEALSLAIPTLFKVMSVKDSGTMEVARKADQMLKSLGGGNQKLTSIRVKVNLFLVALYLASRSGIKDNFLVAKIQLNMVQKARDSELRPLILSEILFANAVYLYKGYKYNCLKSSEFSSKHLIFQEIRSLLKKALTHLEPMLQNDDKFTVTKAKITLLLSKTRNSQQAIEKKLMEDLNEAIKVFRSYGALGLEMKANYLYATLKLDHEQRNMNFKILGNQTPNMRNMTNSLVKVKNMYLVERAIKIAKQIKASQYETKIRRKIDEINMEIQNTYFNVIAIMQATPRVDIKEDGQESNDMQIIPVGYPTKLVSTFKENLLQVLKKSKKVLYLKFEKLTKKMLEDSLVNGCRVLQLYCSSIEEECICVEGPYGRTEKISFDELKRMFSPKAVDTVPSLVTLETLSTINIREETLMSSSVRRSLRLENPSLLEISEAMTKEVQQTPYNNELLRRTSTQDKIAFSAKKHVEVLVLANQYSQKLVDLFVKLEIPHIVTFEFTSQTSSLMQKIYENECIENFCISFYEELVSSKPVFEAFEIAYETVFDYLSKKYFEGRPKTQVRDIIGQGPLLFPKDKGHNESLFGFEKFLLADGKVENISNSYCPTNISEMLIPFTGRNKEIYEVLKRTHKHRGFVEVIGAPGVGKTTFVLQIAYDILNRNLFPDGVFYIPLKQLKNSQYFDYQMEDLLRDILGLDVQLSYTHFFKGKNMLLIFDDFDMVKRKEVEFPSLLLLTLEECATPTIFVTSNTNDNETGNPINRSIYDDPDRKMLGNSFKFHLEGLTDEELGLMLQSLIEVKSNKDLLNVEELKNCSVVKEAKGRPKYVVERLLERKITIREQVLIPNPAYERLLSFEEEYTCDIEPSPQQLFPFVLKRSYSKEKMTSSGFYKKRSENIERYFQMHSPLLPMGRRQKSVNTMFAFGLEDKEQPILYLGRTLTSPIPLRKSIESRNFDVNPRNEAQQSSRKMSKEERGDSQGQDKEEIVALLNIKRNTLEDEGQLPVIADVEKITQEGEDN